jgi:hypothetical protein
MRLNVRRHMSTWCLIKAEAEKFRNALKDGSISPEKLNSFLSSEARREYLGKFVGEENAVQINALFESKLLLKNQKAGMISWAKNVVGITPKVRADLVTRIERLEGALNPKEQETFLHDLVSTRLGVDVTQEEAKQISDMANKRKELKAKIPDNAKVRSKERIEYGIADALLKEHMAKLKYDANKIKFGEQPARYGLDVILNQIPNLSQAINTAYDNSFWLRQGVNALFTPRYTKIWAKNFLKSWKNIGTELKGHDAMLPIKADVYSRPNALNGKFDADPNGYGLGVRSEEVYQSDIPAKIPVLKRLFLASQTAFNGGALQTRADIADLEIAAAETAGLNVMDKKVAQALGSMTSSVTGRGSVGGAESFLRKFFWAPRMYAGQINSLTAHLFDPKANAYTRVQSAKNLASRLGVWTVIFAIAKMLDPDSVDPKDHLGKIKIWGKWVDITGGQASWVTLAMKMADKVIQGLGGKKFGFAESTAFDDLMNFAQGKASPTASVIRDILKSEMYGGEPITLGGMVKNRFTPISTQTFNDLAKDPNASNIFGLMLLEQLGANVSSYMESNEKTKLIPTGEVITYDNFLGMADVYLRAFSIDREDAWNKMLGGQRIMQISPGNIIVVARDDDWDTRKKEYAKKYGISATNIKEVREEHLIPIKGGGEDADFNRKMISKSLWSEFTKVDNAYIKALKEQKLTKKEAEAIMLNYKNSRIGGKTHPTQEETLAKFK